jgi:tRNA-2-methylthio-N6-dimethylallyladenosine synthase
MPLKLYLETFGCQMNVLDSELVLGQLRAQGYQPTEDRDAADVILYNTCSVREHAENKVFSRLGELRQHKKDNPSLVIGVIGCLAERDGQNIFKKNPHIDVLCGPGELDKLQSLIHNAVVANSETRNPQSAIRNDKQVALMGSTTRRSSTLSAAEDNLELLDLSRSISSEDNLAQAYVRITRGCNKFCTYCVVPYTRGPEVHRPPQNIIDEVKRLADAGVKEVTLLGQTINHYHYKPEGGGVQTSFADLLYQIHEAVPALPRLRFVTSFPRDFTDQALQAMRDCERICRYLHVPAQHGSDRILKMMNRGYTAQQYRDFIDRARAYMPDVSIASDFIVGFPTETEEEFQTCIDIIRYARFKNSFIFKYSPRPGTTAIDRFADDIPDDVKRRRNNELLAVQQAVCTANNLELVGKTLEVMVEGETTLASKKAAYPSSPTNGVELGWERRKPQPHTPFSGGPQDRALPLTQLTGRTRGDQVVAFEGPLSLRGSLLPVTITSAKSLTLFGQLAQSPALT